MPDFEDKIPISEFSYTNTLHNTDQAPIIQQDGADWDNFRTSMADIGLHINKEMEYVTDLHTTSKKIIGAINELADGGGSVDITTEITTPASIQTFNDGGDNIPMKSCEVAIVAQQASGTPSPSNSLSISGFSSISVPVVGGKNLFGGSDGVNYPLIIPANKTFSLSCSAGGGKFEYFRKDGTLIDYYFFGYSQSRTITCPETIYSVTLTTVNNPYVDAQIEFANAPTTYEAFKGNNITPVSLGQTIYGGTAELVGGNGTKTFGYVDLGDLSWNYAGGTFRAIVSDAIAPISGGDTTAICEIYNRVGYSSSIADLSFYLCANQLSASKYLVIRDDSYNGNTTTFTAGVTGKKLVYTLATPTAFTFTGATIPTLSGVNNVYADSGDVNELEYFNENADDIASMVRLMTRT